MYLFVIHCNNTRDAMQDFFTGAGLRAGVKYTGKPVRRYAEEHSRLLHEPCVSLRWKLWFIRSLFTCSEKPGLESGRPIVRTSEASPGTLRRPELAFIEQHLPVHLLVVGIHYHLDLPHQ